MCHSSVVAKATNASWKWMKQCRKTNTQITPVKYKHPMIKSKTNIQGHATTDKASFLKYIHTFANKHFSTAIQHTYIVKSQKRH